MTSDQTYQRLTEPDKSLLLICGTLIRRETGFLDFLEKFYKQTYVLLKMNNAAIGRSVASSEGKNNPHLRALLRLIR